MAPINPFWLVLAAGAVSLLPLLVTTLTCYLKVSMVLGIFRSGLGTQQMPGGVLAMALSISLTVIIMSPVIKASVVKISEVDQDLLQKNPVLEGLKVFRDIWRPWQEFLSQNAGPRELRAVAELPGLREEFQESCAAVPSIHCSSPRIVVPAFVLTELREAFAMGFLLLLPFLVIDLVIANLLIGLGMYMVSPTMISLPIKLLLFIAADGWLLLTHGFVASYVPT